MRASPVPLEVGNPLFLQIFILIGAFIVIETPPFEVTEHGVGYFQPKFQCFHYFF
jgi:hypothetical protein